MSRKLFRFGKKKARSVNNLTVSNPNLQLQEEARELDQFLATNDEYKNMLKRQRYGNSGMERHRVIARRNSFYARDELEIAESSKIRLEELLQSCLSRENSRASSVIANLPDDRDRNLQELDIAVQLTKGLPYANEGNQINQEDPGKTPEARNQLEVERLGSRLSDNYLAARTRDTVNPVDMDGRVDNEVLKSKFPPFWKRELHDTEPARFNDYAAQWTPSRKTHDFRARNNTRTTKVLTSHRQGWNKITLHGLEKHHGLAGPMPIQQGVGTMHNRLARPSESNSSICRNEYDQ